MASVSPPVTADAPRARPQRMGELAALPVFFDLGGRRAVMAGGSDAAAWKAELLAAAGARVDLYCPAEDLGEEMRAVLAHAFPAGAIRHHDRPWSTDVFAAAELAVADGRSDGEAHAFSCAARAAGVPANVIDKPDFCRFRFGTIVNRSPVVVGISTAGAAPILGQAIRRRVETLLPATLQGWARLAARLRAEVMARLEPGPARRAFWERLADDAFTRRTPDEAAEADARGFLRDLAGRPEAGGRVTLVGAGPGDAELLTLKAVRALQAADVILFDDLVSDEILELARREARRMLVGKRARRDSCRQEDINRTMVALARAGKHVVRLKSGDVSVFGRSGEEIAELRGHAIPVAIVPGITAASALAAGFGVSLTHRDRSQSVRFVTAHSQRGELPDEMDWRALADRHATTIFYMGGRMAGRIAERLAAEGLPADTPVAVAAAISRPDEIRLVGRLGDLAAIVARVGIERPILIGVGRVFADVEPTALRGFDPERLADASGAPTSRLEQRAG